MRQFGSGGFYRKNTSDANNAQGDRHTTVRINVENLGKIQL